MRASSGPRRRSRGRAPAAGYPRLSGCVLVVPGLAPSGAAEFHRYRDDQGNYHVVDDPSAIPPAHVPGLKVYPESGADPAPTPPLPAPAPAAGDMHPDEVVATPATVRDNRVLVPVPLGYRGRKIQETLLLDTGASRTTPCTRTPPTVRWSAAGCPGRTHGEPRAIAIPRGRG